MLAQIKNRIETLLWQTEFRHAGTTVSRLIRFLRYPYALLRDALEGQLTMRAMSLVYTTLLSIVPLIALSFSILKAFDFHLQIEPIINNFLAPLGPKGAELTAKVLDFVDNVRGVALGSIGLALLIYTVYSMVQKVEESFNYVWQVERTRSAARRFSEYISVILIAPVLMLVAVGLLGAVSSHAITAKLMNTQIIGPTIVAFGKLTPYFLVAAAFSFVYGFVPNTRVRPSAALIGGFTGGALWVMIGALFASFVAGSAKYTAIYATSAVVIVALIWLYISWLILLIGAKISFYVQHPEYLRHGHQLVELRNSLREKIAVSLMAMIADDYRTSGQRWKQNDIAARMGLPGRTLAPIVHDLEARGLLLATEDEYLIPGRDMNEIAVAEILRAVREGEPRGLPATMPSMQGVEELLGELKQAIDQAVKGKTLRDLIGKDES